IACSASLYIACLASLYKEANRPEPYHQQGTRNYWMKRICLILLFCATAFGESNYEKGRLISITDVSKVTQTVSYYGGTPSAYRVKEFRYRLSVQVGDTVY